MTGLNMLVLGHQSTTIGFDTFDQDSLLKSIRIYGLPAKGFSNSIWYRQATDKDCRLPGLPRLIFVIQLILC